LHDYRSRAHTHTHTHAHTHTHTHTHTHSVSDEPTHDVLVNYELCELAPSGEYTPVDIVDEKGRERVFQLQQGVQRKVRVRAFLFLFLSRWSEY
jgi:hypothetical protein